MKLIHVLALLSIGAIQVTNATSAKYAAKVYRPIGRKAYDYHVKPRQDSDNTDPPPPADPEPDITTTTSSADADASEATSSLPPDADATTSSDDSSPPETTSSADDVTTTSSADDVVTTTSSDTGITTTSSADSDVTTSSDDSLSSTASSAPPLVTNIQSGSCTKGQVEKCGPNDMTPDNWQKFGVDDFLKQFIANNSIPDNFPAFLVQQTTSSKFVFDCSSTTSTNCKFPTVADPQNANDCRFVTLHGTVCDGYTDPHVGFMVANYINLHNYQSDLLNAIDDADKAITSSNTIDNLVSALAPQKQDVGLAVFKLIADLVLDIIPIGGEIKAGVDVARTVAKRIGKIVKGVNKDSESIEDITKSNAAIDQQKKVTADGLKQQYGKVIAAAKKSVNAQIAAVFGPKIDPEKPSDPSTSNVFQLAYSGMWLNKFPDRTSLSNQIQLTLKLWLSSRIMVSMGYALAIDTTQLAGSFQDQVDSCNKGRKGFLQGTGCAQFKITGSRDIRPALDGKDPVDLSALTKLINANDVIWNAVDCSGRKSTADNVDFSGFLELGSKAVIPICMFGIPVVMGKA